MGITGKIVFGFLGCSVLFFLVLITFFYPQSDISSTFQVPESFKDQSIITLTGTGDVSLHQLSTYDSLYTNTEDFTILDNNTINLQEGQYMIDIRDLNKKYFIGQSYFDIEFIGFGKVFIDTSNPAKYVIMSFNNTIGLSLKDGTEESEVLTEVFLYPHMVLTFNPSRNKFLKNADLVRVSSVFSLKYFTGAIFSEDPPEMFGNVFESIVAHEKGIVEERHKKLSELQSLETSTFPGTEMIEKYFQLFVNDSKKDIYHKNQAFRNIISLLHSTKKNPTLVRKTIDSINDLQDSPEHYKEIKEVLEYFYKYTLYSFDDTLVYAKLNFADTIKEVEGYESGSDSGIAFSSFFLDSLYSSFDFQDTYSYKNLVSFYETYVQELGIDVSKKAGYTENNRGYLEYLGFFVENIIVSRFSSFKSGEEQFSDLLSEDNLRDILEVMQGYVILNEIVYSNGGQSKIVTLVYQYIGILESVEAFTRASFFKSDRSKDELLERKSTSSITNNTLTLLTGNVNSILDFYASNKKFLDTEKQRDVFIIDTYSTMLERFPEYFLALENYDSYFYTYNEARKNLLDLSIGLGGEDDNLTREAFMKYMSQFQFLSLGSLQLEIEEQFYRASGMFISGKEIAFDLYPLLDSTIENIRINKENVNGSYKLDVISVQWEERARGTSGAERQRYDFSRFFINTFFSTNESTSEVFDIGTQTGEVDKVIVVFKRDRLLGNKGEFADISKTLQIDFEDLHVIAEKDLYSISITDARVSTSGLTQSGQGFLFDADFSSDYLLTDTKHQFRNIDIRPYIINGTAGKEYIFDENIFEIIGSIDLVDFEIDMQEIADSHFAAKYIYSYVARELSPDKVSLKYALFSKKTTMKFDYEGKQVTITLSENDIEKMLYGTDVISADPISYRKVGDIIDTIKVNNK